jgi:hypothetical protein
LNLCWKVLAVPVNIGEKLQLAEVLHWYKNNLDHGKTVDIHNHFSEIVGVFRPEVQEEDISSRGYTSINILL